MTTYVSNRRARFDFDIVETFEAGISLLGTEVKAVRAGKGTLAGAYILVHKRAVMLVGATIPPFQEANAPAGYDKKRPRPLLLSQKEIGRIHRAMQTQGLTTIPIRLYNAGRNLKLQIAIARGKRKFDKRNTIKSRDAAREIARQIKNKA